MRGLLLTILVIFSFSMSDQRPPLSSYLSGIAITGETVRNALTKLGVRWKRAKHWITSPDPDYVRKKKRRDALIRLVASHPTWALGFQDEVWWSRLAQPDQHRWADEDTVTQLQELQRSKADSDPQALACFPSRGSWTSAPPYIRLL